MAETSSRGHRIGPESWQILLGVGGASNPGPRPPEKRSRNPCRDCGYALHAHDQTRVNHDDGRYSYDLECP